MMMQRSCLTRRYRPSAFSLVEAAVSMLLVAGLMVAALNTVGAASLNRQKMSNRARGQLLAMELLAEILQQPYEELDDEVNFGRESSESGGDRADYDDVDDYDGWASSPPERSDGTELAELSDWTRTVTVTWVTHDDHETAQGTETGIKKIEVRALWNQEVAASVVALRCRSGDAVVVDPGSLLIERLP